MVSKQSRFDLSLRTKVLGAILLAALPLVFSIIFFTFYIQGDEEDDNRVTAYRMLRVSAARVLDLAVDAETGVRGFLVTKRRRFLEPYWQAERAMPGALDELERLAGEEDRPTVLAVDALVTKEMRILAALEESPIDGDKTVTLGRGKAVMDRLRATTAELVAAAAQEMDETIADRASLRTNAYRALFLGGGIGALSSIWAGVVLVGSFVRRVERNTENARRLAEGGELLSAEQGNDELAEQSRRLHETALLLRARESALRQAREEADRANKAKSEFLSRMSHELRTPLNAVIGFAQLLKDEVTPEAREDVREILRAGKHLLGLIDEVLDLSRIEAGVIRMSVEPVSVRDVLNESVVLIRGRADERSITIRVGNFDADLHVRADRQRFKQVLLNLLSNSVKYNRDAGSVQVTISREGESVRISVADEGNGIPLRLQRDLFAPFSRLGAERTSIEGTGLGLVLSKHLMEAMGGDIGFESQERVGSTFWLLLPYTSETHSSTEERSEMALRTVPSSSSVVDVLQFEDNPSNIRLMERALRARREVRLRTATTGAEGFLLISNARPHLILLDVNLPDMSGTDVLVRLRANPSTRDVPVIVLSADATESQIEHMLSLGAERYLTKPIDMQELNDVLDAVLTRLERADDSDG